MATVASDLILHRRGLDRCHRSILHRPTWPLLMLTAMASTNADCHGFGECDAPQSDGDNGLSSIAAAWTDDIGPSSVVQLGQLQC
mmetsp:Transcript_34994/g.57122  ORF Transcript_34994/g.57122 Transcript_34994/m.57122 type:complete len:85 (+) Transcript_34994:500-754(+)